MNPAMGWVGCLNVRVFLVACGGSPQEHAGFCAVLLANYVHFQQWLLERI